MRRNRTALVLAWLAACGSGGPALAPDAAARDAARALGPDSPVLTPCAPGWREVVDPSGLVFCDPWPESGRARCAATDMHLPGTAGCARVGSACPADGWPAALPSGGVVFVDPTAAPGGDGATRATALGTFHEAVASAPDGSVVALRAGLYDETALTMITTTRSLSVVGACASGTTIAMRLDGSTRGLVLGADLALRDVALDGVPVQPSTGTTTIEDVRMGEGAGLLAVGGRVSVRRSLMRLLVFTEDTIAVVEDVVDVDPNIALQLQHTAHVSAQRLVVSSVAASDAATLDLTGSVVEGGTDGGAGSLQCERVTLTDCFVGDSAASGLKLDAVATLTRTRIGRVRGQFGLLTSGPVALHDVVVHDIGSETGTYGLGLGASFGGSLALSRVATLRTRVAGMVAYEASTITATDVRVEDVSSACVETDCASGPIGGFGLASRGGTLAVSRFSVERDALCGVVIGVDASVDLADGWIDDSPIGACVQATAFDPERVHRNVEYRAGVTTPLQATTYTLPPPPR